MNDLRSAYRALVRDGTTAVQEDFLNGALLRRVWSALILPERCRHVWESRFPDLRT